MQIYLDNAIIIMLHIFNNPKLGHTVGKNVCSHLVLGKCVATLRGAFFVRSLWAHFLFKEKIMEFKRFDVFLSRYNIIQKKFDKELPVCPFCDEFPHWYLNVQNGFNLVSATCMCEKCKAKLNTEYKVLNIKRLKAVDLGEKNVHNLELNTTYSLEALRRLPQN